MLPCQNTCSHYCEGCHKNCAQWKAYQAQQKRQREEKQAYLKHYQEIYSTVARQYSALRVRYSFY